LSFAKDRFLQALCALFLLVWIVSAIHPEIPEDWLLENLLVFVLVGLLAFTYRVFPLSRGSYLAICILLCLREAGAHYQYAAVPAGEWVKVSAGWASMLVVFTTLALSAIYEIIEAIVASVASPEAGDAYLGSQGDPWDSQKDMLCAFVGATISMVGITVLRMKDRRETSV
jgi:putative membrane protein